MRVEVIVVGAGLIGAAAARYLSQAGASVAVIGPAEPADYQSHKGVFSSHYDSGRLTHRLSKDLTWGHLAHQAQQQYRLIETQSGLRFYEPCGGLTVALNLTRLGQAHDWPAIVEAFGVPVTHYPDAQAITARHPMFAFPATMQGYFEPNPA
ncbi:MAG: FAD-dependent oxidoreductase, partial [Anaerolineae bacterium]|nr:FAD-dependent oxidoreductase [Anaerolineae bacterium]